MPAAAIKTTVRVLVIPLEPDNEPYALIPLHGKYGQGKVAKVSLQDVARVRRHRWYGSSLGYVIAYIPKPRGHSFNVVKLHRFIFGLKNGDSKIIDHRGHDPLDNRRSKLRESDGFKNMWNRRVTGRGSSKYKGVSKRKQDTLWSAGIRVGGRHVPLGSFETETEAARAYDSAALFHYGEFAHVNFADSLPRPAGEIRQESRRAPEKTAPYLGVRRKKGRSGFQARVKSEKEDTYIGSFATAEEAARAYDACMRHLHGDKAKTNFPGTEAISPEDMRKQSMGRELEATVRGESKYRYVHWNSKGQKWSGSLMGKELKKYLGLFATEEEAARAVDAARIAVGLEPTNFPRLE
jgi:hypothetical protein